MSTTRTYPSLRQLADQFSETPEYAPLRTYIRGTISAALGEATRKDRQRELTDRECITHSLIASWLHQNGYLIAHQMMKTQMAETYQESPEKFLQNPSENLDSVLKNHLKIQVPKLDRTPKPMQNGPGFPKVNTIEMKREPIKITPLSDDEYNRVTRQRMELERARLKMAQEIDDSDDSDDSSTSSSSDASVSPHKSSSDTEIEEKKPTFLDILKSSKQQSEKSSETPILPSSLGSLGGLEFLGNPAPKSWGPSKSGLVTDDVAPPSESLASLAHLPSLSMNRPTLKTAKSEDIDALFEEDMAEYLGDFSDFSDGEKTPKAEVERKSPEKIIVEKPVNVVPPVVKKEEPMQVEPVVLSEEDSIDELDDFDTADLSSGGSDFSF
ncbi:unnamed protein product [Caenorhabditis brenneri]